MNRKNSRKLVLLMVLALLPAGTTGCAGLIGGALRGAAGLVGAGVGGAGRLLGAGTQRDVGGGQRAPASGTLTGGSSTDRSAGAATPGTGTQLANAPFDAPVEQPLDGCSS